jgi:hypothetical protein
MHIFYGMSVTLIGLVSLQIKQTFIVRQNLKAKWTLFMGRIEYIFVRVGVKIL